MSKNKERIIGFQSGHDVSYCVLENGIPIIHEELERFTREKEPFGDGLKMFFDVMPSEDVESLKYFCYGNPGNRTGRIQISKTAESKNELASEKMNNLIEKNDGEFFVVSHHQSHAANAFFSSNFDEALIITIDGAGIDKVDWKDIKTERDGTDEFSFPTSFTFWVGKGNKIKPLKRIHMYDQLVTHMEINVELLWLWLVWEILISIGKSFTIALNGVVEDLQLLTYI